MGITIRYLSQDTEGVIESSKDFSQAVWNRIIDLVIGVQPDAIFDRNSVTASWATILAIVQDVATLRLNFGFNVSYDDEAKKLLVRYREEVLAVRKASGTLTQIIQEDQVQGKLCEKGFVRRDLKSPQKRDLVKLVSLSNGANFSVPGAGKTTVAFATHLLTRDDDTYLLVVAPKNAFGAWDEVVKDCMEDKMQVKYKFSRLEGGTNTIISILRHPPRLMLISYDQLIRVKDTILDMLSRYKVHVVLDESHRMKAGDKSLRGTALLNLAHLPVRRDLLSGTPIPRSIEDIGPQFDFLWPGQGIGWQAVQAEKPNTVLRSLYVRTTKHELELPPITREFIAVEMSPPQIALYMVIRREAIKRLVGIKNNINVDLYSAKRSVMRLLQISSNPILMVRRLTEEEPLAFQYDDPTVKAIFTAIAEEIDSPKILRACDLARSLAAQGLKTVIWTSFTDNVERIAELLKDIGATYIHGKTPTGCDHDTSTREGRIKAFHQQDECMVLVANPAACSEGISLHMVCHHAIYVDRTFNAAHYLQSVDRIHRLGLPPDTKTKVLVLESIAPQDIGAIDYSVRRRLIDKLHIMAEALDDPDLNRLALDEEDADIPLDYDITMQDLADVLDELLGKTVPPREEEGLW